MLVQRNVVLLCLTALAIPVSCESTGWFENFLCSIIKCKKSDTNDALAAKYGHHVSIRFNGEHHCSGSIINDRHILTLYSCISSGGYYDNGPQKKITVVAGTTRISNSDGETFDVQEVIVPKDRDDDIALLRTREIIYNRGHIRQIKIKDYKTIANFSPLTIAAWRHSSSEGTEDNSLLKEYSQRLFDKYKCRERYSWTKKEKMCTYDEFGQGLCVTDAGGGIIADGYLIGIHSNGEECYDGGEAKSHTPISPYIDWIAWHISLEHDKSVPPIIRDEPNNGAARGQYPYLVSISAQNNQHICSGSIINERHILTSLNCVSGYGANQLTVKTGVSDLNQLGVSYGIRQIIPSKDYNFDIAILRTTENIIFNRNVNPIPIIKKRSTTYEYGTVMLVGYERPIIDSYTSPKVRQISIRVPDRGSCLNVIPLLNEVYACGLISHSQRACNMDYGSPIVSDGIQTAIIPANVRCEEGDGLLLHLPLQPYLWWIEDNSRLWK